ncbi:MAG TPA: hypothetical protein VJQ45_04130 [Ktedonobacterales bacterium]|nr:hypothetical protein [Ktedonobacterales bacterium]
MGDSQKGKRKGLFGRLVGGKTERTVEKLTLVGVLAAAGAELVRSSSRMRSYTDVQLQNIARGLTSQLNTIMGESARLERTLRTREGKQALPLAMALATLDNFAALLDGVLLKSAALLAQTNPELKAVTVDPGQTSGVRALPSPADDTLPGHVVDADPVPIPGASQPGIAASGPVTQPLTSFSAPKPPPSLGALSDRQRNALADDLRAAFTEIIGGVQYVQATIGDPATTNSIKIDTAIAQARALVADLRARDRRVREKYGVG